MSKQGRPRKLPQLTLSNGRWRCEARNSKDERVTVRFGTVTDVPEVQARQVFAEWLEMYVKDPDIVERFDGPHDAVRHRRAEGTDAPLERLLTERVAYLKGREKPEDRDHAAGNRGMLERAVRHMGQYLTRPVNDFGPAQLEVVQLAMVDYRYRRTGDPEGTNPRRYLRRSINRAIGEVKQAFVWGIGRGMVSKDMAGAIATVAALRPGQTTAPESLEREAIEPDEMKAVLDPTYINSVLADLLRVIWYTGCRPEEACVARGMDIDMADETCWLYTPGSDTGPFGRHKMASRGRPKYIPMLPIVQRVLLPYLTTREPNEYLFSPREAMDIILKKRHEARKTPLSCGNRPTGNPMITPGAHYPPESVYTALQRACARAKVLPFAVYDIRRTVATWLEMQSVGDAGLEVAKDSLGHTSTSTTQIYLRKHKERAIRRAKQIAPLIESRLV